MYLDLRDLCEVILFRSEVSYGKVLGDKMRCTLSDLVLRVLDSIVTISFGYILYCVLACTVVVLTCFVVCGCVYVWVL